jgi:hypothetical protein
LVHIALDRLPDGLISKRENLLSKLYFEFTKYKRQINDYMNNDAEVFNNTIRNASIFFTRFCMPMVNCENLLKDNANIIIASTQRMLLRRVVGYGALGTIGKAILPTLAGTLLAPTELWDIAAGDDASYIAGIPLYKPDFDSLAPGDIVCVFPRKTEVVKDIAKKLEGKNVSFVFNEKNNIAALCVQDLLF